MLAASATAALRQDALSANPAPQTDGATENEEAHTHTDNGAPPHTLPADSPPPPSSPAPSPSPSPFPDPGDPVPAASDLHHPLNGHDLDETAQTHLPMGSAESEKNTSASLSEDEEDAVASCGVRALCPPAPTSSLTTGQQSWTEPDLTLTHTSSPFPCPLCQEQCPSLPQLERHLTLAHKVTREGMKKILSMVDTPEVPPSKQTTSEQSETPEENRKLSEKAEEIRRDDSGATCGHSGTSDEVDDNTFKEGGTKPDLSQENMTIPEHDREETEVHEESRRDQPGTDEGSCGETWGVSESMDGDRDMFDASVVDSGPSSASVLSDPQTASSSSSTLLLSSSSSLSSLSSSLQREVLDGEGLEQLEEVHEGLAEGDGVADLGDGSEEVYRCPVCAADFTSIDKMFAHQKELGHLELKQTRGGLGYLCYKKGCNQYFKTIDALRTHIKEIHEKKCSASMATKLSCPQCPAEFKDPESLQCHSVNHRLKVLVQCEVCKKCCQTVDLLKCHLRKEHGDLGEAKLENLLKRVSENFTALVNSSGSETPPAKSIELAAVNPGPQSVCSSATGEQNQLEKSSSVQSPSTPKHTSSVNALPSTTEEPSSGMNKAHTMLTGKENSEQGEKPPLDMTQDPQKTPSDQQRDVLDPQTWLDQKTVEDALNKEHVALARYKDRSRPFKCHPCKMAFTAKHYLLIHRRLSHKIPEKFQAYYAMERYQDPNRPYKCVPCKASFLQKNALLVHLNSVGHLRKANETNSQGSIVVVSDSSTTSPTDPVSLNSPNSQPPMPAFNTHILTANIGSPTVCIAAIPAQPFLSSSSCGPDPDSDDNKKEEHQCDICNISFRQNSELETHFRSVAHQRHVVQLHKEAISNAAVSNDCLSPLVGATQMKPGHGAGQMKQGHGSAQIKPSQRTAQVMPGEGAGHVKPNQGASDEEQEVPGAAGQLKMVAGMLWKPKLTTEKGQAMIKIVPIRPSSGTNAVSGPDLIPASMPSFSPPPDPPCRSAVAPQIPCSPPAVAMCQESSESQTKAVTSERKPSEEPVSPKHEETEVKTEAVNYDVKKAEAGVDTDPADFSQKSQLSEDHSVHWKANLEAVADLCIHAKVKNEVGGKVGSVYNDVKKSLESSKHVHPRPKPENTETELPSTRSCSCAEVKMEMKGNGEFVTSKVHKKSKESEQRCVESKSKLEDMATEIPAAGSSNCMEVKCNCSNGKQEAVDDVDSLSTGVKNKVSVDHAVHSKLHLEEISAELPNCVAVKTEAADDFNSVSGSRSTGTSTLQTVLKSEMSTNTTDSPLPSAAKSSDYPSNPLLAASVPLNITPPRGYMGRFKPHLQRNLLENFGFECVMQFHENAQMKRKGRGKDKERKRAENRTEKSDNCNTTAEPSDSHEKPPEKDSEVKTKVELPEINKSVCQECGYEFSSIFVLKAHEEEAHKNRISADVLEEFWVQIKNHFEKKQPKVEAAVTSVSTSSVSCSTVSAISNASATTSHTTTTSTSTSTSSPAADKSSLKSSKEDMPPPPPPLRQLPPGYDMSQMMPMLNMVPMNLMSLGMQSSLSPILSSGAVDLAGSFPASLSMMESGLQSPQQALQRATSTQNEKRGRTRINDDQLKILRSHFDIKTAPTEDQISQMVEMSGLPIRVIKHWFRNTLFKERQRNKDSPYNFNNPPSTTIDLEEYEKTGRIPATVIKMEVADDDDNHFAPSRKEERNEESEFQAKAKAYPPPPPPPPLPPPARPSFLQELPTSLQEHFFKQENRDDFDYQSDDFTLSSSKSPGLSTLPRSVPSSSGPLPCSPASILDAQAIVLAREAAAAAQNAATKRANRTRFTDLQVKILQDYFEQNAYPKDEELDHLSKVLNLNPRVIVVWFQNARQKARKVSGSSPSLEAKDNGNAVPFQKTPSLNNHCSKCGAVFQRQHELLKHQKLCCLSENNNNKPLLAFADEDSFSSCTSLEDSGLSDSLNLSVSSQKNRTSPSLLKTYLCEKCDLSFNHWDQLQEHQKTRHQIADFSHAVSSASSAFGLLQSVASHNNHKTSDSFPMTSSPTAARTSASSTPQPLMTVNSNKHKLEAVDSDHSDDQPKDKRLRTTILPEQLEYLYQKYQQDCNPSRKQLELISEEVGLKKRVVQVWFQNTRARERKGHPRTYQQLIHKRCPFCNALFRARSALESHLVNKHPIEMAKGDINIDALPDADVEPPQHTLSLPGTSSSGQTPPSVADISQMFSSPSVSPYLSFLPSSNLALGFPPTLPPIDSVQLSMQNLYEDAFKKYITELSGSALSPVPLLKASHTPDTIHSSPVSHSKSPKKPEAAPSTASIVDVDDAPLDLSIVKKEPSHKSSVEASATHVFRDKSKAKPSQHAAKDRHRSRSPQERTPSHSSHTAQKQTSSRNDTSSSHSLSAESLYLTFKNNPIVKSHPAPHMPSLTLKEKVCPELEHNRSFIQEDPASEPQSEVSDGQCQGELGSCPSSPKSVSSAGSVQKRHRTQMTSLQVKVMKLLFVDYKTPTMAECELVGHQIGLAKRVVQVWFQNARAKEKKFKQTMNKPPVDELDYPKTAEECLLCHFKYSHKFTLQDHIFTQQHIDNIKGYIHSQVDQEREAVDAAPVSGGSLRQPAPQDGESKAWEKLSSTLSAQQMNQLQQGLNAAALGLPAALPGVGSPFSLSSLPSVPDTPGSKQHSKDSHPKKEKKKETPAASSKASSSGSSQKDPQPKQSQQQQKKEQSLPSSGQQVADYAQMMALGGYLPGLDPTYMGYLYPGLPSFYPGLTPMPLLSPALLPGAEYMFAHDPLSFGTPLPLLQIPPQAIKAVSEKIQDAKCVRTHYSQDCKTLADLKGSLGPRDSACLVETSVDVGYICKKCQMVYPSREGCLTHQQLVCYPAGDVGTKTMVKLEQLQYQCGQCGGESFSTVSEARSHCQKDSHKAKVSKASASVLPSSSSSASPRTIPKPATSTSASSVTSSSSKEKSSSPLSQSRLNPLLNQQVPSQTTPKPPTPSSAHSISNPSPAGPSQVSPAAADNPSTAAQSTPDPPPSSPLPSQTSEQSADASTDPSTAPHASPTPDNPSSSLSSASAPVASTSLVSSDERSPSRAPSPPSLDALSEKPSKPDVSLEADVSVDPKSTTSE